MSTPATGSASPSGATTSKISWAHAVLIEVVSIAASGGVGHLVAGWALPLSSPFRAIADTVVRHPPEWLTGFAGSLAFPAIGLPKGVVDKILPLVGIGVALLVVGLLAGLLAHWSRSAGRAVIIFLGLVGLVAVLSSRASGWGHVVAPLMALQAGLSVYFRLYNIAEHLIAAQAAAVVPLDGQVEQPSRDGHPARTGSSDPIEMSRRKLIRTSAVLGGGSVAVGVVGQLLASTRPSAPPPGRP